MSERIERFESAVERQIREAQERGEFDDLPGKGKPLPGLADPDDELWWVRGYLRREALPTEVLLPESLQLRKQLERLDETVAALPTEQAVRDHVHQLNAQVKRARVAPSGPPVVLRLARADDVVARWRAARSSSATAPPSAPGSGAASEPARCGTGEPEPRPSWWHRLTRRDRR